MKYFSERAMESLVEKLTINSEGEVRRDADRLYKEYCTEFRQIYYTTEGLPKLTKERLDEFIDFFVALPLGDPIFERAKGESEGEELSAKRLTNPEERKEYILRHYLKIAAEEWVLYDNKVTIPDEEKTRILEVLCLLLFRVKTWYPSAAVAGSFLDLLPKDTVSLVIGKAFPKNPKREHAATAENTILKAAEDNIVITKASKIAFCNAIHVLSAAWRPDAGHKNLGVVKCDLLLQSDRKTGTLTFGAYNLYRDQDGTFVLSKYERLEFETNSNTEQDVFEKSITGEERKGRWLVAPKLSDPPFKRFDDRDARVSGNRIFKSDIRDTSVLLERLAKAWKNDRKGSDFDSRQPDATLRFAWSKWCDRSGKVHMFGEVTEEEKRRMLSKGYQYGWEADQKGIDSDKAKEEIRQAMRNAYTLSTSGIKDVGAFIPHHLWKSSDVVYKLYEKKINEVAVTMTFGYSDGRTALDDSVDPVVAEINHIYTREVVAEDNKAMYIKMTNAYAIQ